MLPRLILILRRLYHYLAYVAGGAVIAVCIVALAFKFWLMPNISSYEGMLEDQAGKALGQPVEIGALEADWSGLNPRVILRDVQMRAPAGSNQPPPLRLPRVEASLSWLSLALFDLRLARLHLEQPQLFMQRDKAGVIRVAGIAVNQPGESGPFPDWLLKQPRIVIKDAELIWRDELLDAPELRLSQVRLLLENRFGRHRFGGIAQPTAAAARRLELRGDLNGRSLQTPESWSGQVYARVDDARFESWGRWVPWAQDAVRSGTGDMRFWLKVKQGKAQALDGDVRLDRVAINIDPTLPDLLFDSLTGRAGWSRLKDEHSFYVDHLRFKPPGGAVSEAANVRIGLTPNPAGGFKRIGLSTRNLRLEALTALTGALPIPKSAHDLIQALNPRGLVAQADGHWSGQNDYAIKLDLAGAGLNPYQKFPGVSGLSARIEANPRGGQVALDGRGLTLALPNVFRHDLGFTQLDATADWQFDDAGMKLNLLAKRILNPDLDGEAEGHLLFPKQGPIHADVTAHLKRGEAKAVYRYLPKVVGDETYHWLQQGLLAGQSDDVRLVLKGPLDRFPFDKGGGEFKVAIKMVNGVLDYATGWPRIDGVNGMLVFHDIAMTLNADSGRILDAQLGPVTVSIPDLHAAKEELLIIDGQATGETRTFLDFIRRSPVNEHTGRFTEPFKAVGAGRLNMRINIPLRNLDATTLNGSYAFADNQLDPGGDLPELNGVTGSVQFTQSSLQAKAIQARVLNMPVALNIDSAAAVGDSHARQLRVRLDGQADALALKPYLPSQLASRVRGSTRWQADIGMNASGKSGLSVSSDLVGVAIDLPAPLGKVADQAITLRISKETGKESSAAQSGAGETDNILARYGDLFGLRAQLPKDAPARLHLRFGAGEVNAPTEAGLNISGALRRLDLDAWRALDLAGPAAGVAEKTGVADKNGITAKLPLREASVVFNELHLFNRRFNDTHVRVRPAGGGWRVVMAGREVSGELVTIPAGDKLSVLANFKRLGLPESLPDKTPTALTKDDDSLADHLVSLELSADSTQWQGRELGELHLRISPDTAAMARGGGLRMENFQLKSADGVLRGKGTLANHPRRPTRFEVELESDNLGKLLDQLGYPGRLKRGAGRISGPLGWTGGVERFNLATLSGDLNLDLKQGQFTKVDPGAGKLLGMLSLQSLPRRIALDFRDVFSEGFAFDEIIGNVHLERGSAYFKDLKMNGPAAKVRMSGVADLVHESQNLRVTIQPRLEDTVALAGALLGGPVVGVGTFIANKILQNPIGQAATFEYAISGPWAEPVVTKLARPKAKNEGDG
jgi:uncharacterized protein (TIGR02099 family)